MTGTPEHDRERTERVKLMVLRADYPKVADLFQEQREPFLVAKEGDKLRRLRTAQLAWLEERRKKANPRVNEDDEFAQQKKEYLALEKAAITQAPLRDGRGLVTLKANGHTGGIAEMARQSLEHAPKELTDLEKEIRAKGVAEGWLNPEKKPKVQRKKKAATP